MRFIIMQHLKETKYANGGGGLKRMGPDCNGSGPELPLTRPNPSRPRAAPKTYREWGGNGHGKTLKPPTPSPPIPWAPRPVYLAAKLLPRVCRKGTRPR